MPFAGSTIAIEYKAPGGSYVDISTDCIASTWSFNLQMAAIAGTFDGIVRDKNQTHTFITGGEIRCTLANVVLWGGYVLAAEKTFAFDAADTVTHGASAVKVREWRLSGSDYNFKLDKLIFRNPTDYVHFAPQTTTPIFDGAIIRTYYPTYFDVPGDWDLTTYVQDNFQFTGSGDYAFGAGGDGQGFSMRAALADLTQYGAVGFMGPDKALRFLAVQNTSAPWGFSDAPVASAVFDGSQPWIGFREGSQSEDLTPVVNDAMVWGGSEWANNGAVVADREQNASSITAHGRWQYAEVRVGDARYKIQAEVNARAQVIVSGNTTGANVEGQQGLANPEIQYRLVWFGHEVPVVLGVTQHLLPSFAVKLHLWTFSPDGGTSPLVVKVPLRSVNISFPSLDPTGKPYARFEGQFGILVTDPEYLWAFLRGNLAFFRKGVVGGVYAAAGSSTTGPVAYGTQWSGPPTPLPNGAATVFTIPYGYIGGTTTLEKNGLRQRVGIDYTESDPAGGQITWTGGPLLTGDVLWLLATLTG